MVFFFRGIDKYKGILNDDYEINDESNLRRTVRMMTAESFVFWDWLKGDDYSNNNDKDCEDDDSEKKDCEDGDGS